MISIEKSLQPIIKIGTLRFNNIKIEKSIQGIIRDIDKLSTELRLKYKTTGDALDQLSITRSLYRKINQEPTKTRPSSEALLRRLLKGKPLFQINSIVDISNYCSISFLLSIGLYDLEKISGEIILRLGKINEGYSGIGKEYINVSNRYTLADDLGPFGNPSSDSDRTKITLDTKNILFVVFAPTEYDDNQLKKHLDLIKYKVDQYHSYENFLME